MESRQSDIPVDEQDVEGLDTQDGSWGDYPIDELLRSKNRNFPEGDRRGAERKNHARPRICQPLLRFPVTRAG